jgi:hypothetical protein
LAASDGTADEAQAAWLSQRSALHVACWIRPESTHVGLAALRVWGIERVRLHADLIVLARLAQALSRARAVPVAA